MGKQRSRRPSIAFAGVVGAALVAAGASGAAILLPEPVPAGLGASAGPDAVAVVGQVFDGERSAQARPVLADETVVSGRTAGTVTGTHCVPGETLASGDVVVEINGRTVVALATRVPIWRDLAVGAQGDDVLALQEELARLGHTVPQDGRFRAQTQAAVRALLGERRRGAGALPLDRVLWLATESITPAVCHLTLGDDVARGDPWVTSESGLVSLEVPNPPDANGWVVVFHDEHVTPLGTDGVITDPAFLAAVADSVELEWALGPQGNGTVGVNVRLAEAVDVAVVPPSAISVIEAGRGCVLADGAAQPVTIVGSSLGQTMVQLSPMPREVSVVFPADASC